MTDPEVPDRIRNQLELGILIGQQSKIDRLLQGLLAFGHSSSNRGTPKQIHAHMPENITETLVQDTLSYLDSVGWLSSEFRDGQLLYQVTADKIIEPLTGAREMLAAANHIESNRDPERFELVCTLPDSDPSFEEYHPVDFGLEQITSKLLELCGTANRRIVLFSPFLNRGGLEWLVPGLESAIERGVSVELVSKQLDEGSANNHALSSLIEMDQHDVPGSLHIYDYFQAAPESESDYPAYTLHAKMILVDRTAGYIGSANFTDHAFTRYLELGAILYGDQISKMSELADRIIENSAKRVYPA